MSLCGTTVSYTVLPATEFCDILCTRYNVTPINLQRHCNRCGATFKVRHALISRKVGLVIARQNKLCDELLCLARRAFTSASVHTGPLP